MSTSDEDRSSCCFRNRRENSDEDKLDFNNVVLSQPIGQHFFRKYCQKSYKEWLIYFDFLLLHYNCDFNCADDKDKFITRFQYLTSNIDEKLNKKSKQTKRLKRIALSVIETNFDLNGIEEFTQKINDFFKCKVLVEFQKTIYFHKYTCWKDIEKEYASHKGYEECELLSSGSFGVVRLCKSRITGRLFACKYYHKSQTVLVQKQKLITNEKTIFEKTDSPFLVKLFCIFQTNDSICFVTNYMQAGDLKHHLMLNKNGLQMPRVRFYAAEIVCGLIYLHSKNIVHFDLKPENILMDHRGHLQICDFGFARIMNSPERINVIIGTLIYISPEVLNKNLVHFASDWFSFGCVLYELIKSRNPFQILMKKKKLKLKQAILYGKVLYSDDFDEDAKSLCEKLLQKDPNVRYELGVGGVLAQLVTKHPFFKGLNWIFYKNLQCDPPYIPDKSYRYHDQYINMKLRTAPDDWTEREEHKEFYETICTGAHSKNWQLDIIESGSLNKLNI